MENSGRYMLRKRKHSHIDDTSDNKCSDVKFKPGLSDAVVDISTNSENSGSHGNSPTECSTVDTQDVIASSSSSNLTVLGISHKPNSFSELPEAVMDNIYRCLPSNDLINIRDVCDLWKEFADKSSVWKHVPFHLDDNNIGKLSETPYIHTVTGCTANYMSYLTAMLNHLKDLRKMNVIFYPLIPTVYVQKLARKFANLESIILSLSAPNITETLDVLQNCPKLKKIQFFCFNKPYFYSWKSFFDKLGNIKPLNTFDLTVISQHVSSSDVLYLLELKMKQLVSLKVSFDRYTKQDILDNISTVTSKIICDSDSLERLEFLTYKKLPNDIILNFARIENLKSLKLWLQPETQLNLLNQVTFPSSLEFFDLLFFQTPNTSKILEHVIMSCPNLKYLKVSGINDEDINEQLEQINVLKNLHTIILEYCQCLSPKGLQHIGKCSNLRYLALTETSVDDSVYTSLKACKYLKEIKLEKCDIRLKNLVPTILYLEHLTHLHLCTCYRKNGNNKVRFSAKYLKHIFRKCKKKNQVLNINW